MKKLLQILMCVGIVTTSSGSAIINFSENFTSNTNLQNNAAFNNTENTINQMLADKYMAGANVFITKKNTTVFAKSYGVTNIQNETPTTEDTLYRVMSMTKPLTTVAFLKLVDIYNHQSQKLTDEITGNQIETIDLETTLLKSFFPEWDKKKLTVGFDKNAQVPAESDITIKQLLTMTSGVQYLETDDALVKAFLWKSLGWDSEKLAQEMATLPLANQPGENWHYGLNMELLTCIGDKILSNLTLPNIPEKTWIDYVTNQFLVALKMTNSYYGKAIPEDKIKNLATVSKTVNNDGDVTIEDDYDNLIANYGWQYDLTKDQNCILGGSTLICTAADYAKFQRFMLSGTDDQGNQLVNYDIIKAMTTSQVSDVIQQKMWEEGTMEPGDSYGYGLAIKINTDGIDIPLKSYGWDGMFSSMSKMNKEDDITVCVMINVTDINKTLVDNLYENIFADLKTII